MRMRILDDVRAAADTAFAGKKRSGWSVYRVGESNRSFGIDVWRTIRARAWDALCPFQVTEFVKGLPMKIKGFGHILVQHISKDRSFPLEKRRAFSRDAVPFASIPHALKRKGECIQYGGQVIQIHMEVPGFCHPRHGKGFCQHAVTLQRILHGSGCPLPAVRSIQPEGKDVGAPAALAEAIVCRVHHAPLHGIPLLHEGGKDDAEVASPLPCWALEQTVNVFEQDKRRMFGFYGIQYLPLEHALFPLDAFGIGTSHRIILTWETGAKKQMVGYIVLVNGGNVFIAVGRTIAKMSNVTGKGVLPLAAGLPLISKHGLPWLVCRTFGGQLQSQPETAHASEKLTHSFFHYLILQSCFSS